MLFTKGLKDYDFSLYKNVFYFYYNLNMFIGSIWREKYKFSTMYDRNIAW